MLPKRLHKDRTKRSYKDNQLTFFKVAPKQFGGSLMKGNPRSKRVLSTKNALHVVLKSTHAKNCWAFNYQDNKGKVDGCIRKQAKLNSIRIYGLQIMHNHVHLNCLFPSRTAYQRFIRSISGLIPRIVMGCEKGRPAIIENFWAARPFTSIITWGRHFKIVVRYFKLNQLEDLGFSRPYARAILAIPP